MGVESVLLTGGPPLSRRITGEGDNVNIAISEMIKWFYSVRFANQITQFPIP